MEDLASAVVARSRILCAVVAVSLGLIGLQAEAQAQLPPRGQRLPGYLLVDRWGEGARVAQTRLIPFAGLRSFEQWEPTPFPAGAAAFVSADLDGNLVPELHAVESPTVVPLDLTGDGSAELVRLDPGSLPLVPSSSGTWQFGVADLDGDCRADLFSIDPTGSSGRVEVTVLSGATGFSTPLTGVPTALTASLDWEIVVTDLQPDGVIDLLALHRSEGGRTTVRVLSADDSFGSVRFFNVVRDEVSPADRFELVAPTFVPLRGPVEAVPRPRRLIRVGGITVHPCLAGPLGAMITAARRDGVRLTGRGFRSTAQQISARRKNCGTRGRPASAAQIWFFPTESCRPPTAPPGLSMHERGLAVDFQINRRVLRWLRANAGRFGFVNYPPEPWHWSTNGE